MNDSPWGWMAVLRFGVWTLSFLPHSPSAQEDLELACSANMQTSPMFARITHTLSTHFRSVMNNRKAVAIVQKVLICPNQVSLGSNMWMLVHPVYQIVSWCCHGNTENALYCSHVPTRLPFALNCCVSQAGLLLADRVLSCLSVFGAAITGRSLGYLFIWLL